MRKHILLVCTGNTCRSPMAEAMLRKLSQDAGLELEVRSAGVSTMNGLPMSPNSREVLKRKQLQDVIQSSSITEELVEEADLVLTMTVSHKRMLLQAYPEAVDKTFTLKEYIADDLSTQKLLDERNALLTDLQMKSVLGEKITDDEKARLIALESQMPSFDIADPFGGSLQEYEECAQEIEAALHRLVYKLRSQG